MSTGVNTGKAYITGGMFLPFSFHPLLFCSHKKKWSSPFPRLNSVSHHVSSWHLLGTHRDILGTAKTICIARGRIIIHWINETCVKLNCPSNILSTLPLHVSEEMGTIWWQCGTISTPLLQVLCALGWSHLNGNLKEMQQMFELIDAWILSWWSREKHPPCLEM